MAVFCTGQGTHWPVRDWLPVLVFAPVVPPSHVVETPQREQGRVGPPCTTVKEGGVSSPA